MAAHRMAAVDAQFYWMSAKVPSDQFLIYVFDGVPVDFDGAIGEVLDRVCPELMVRADDGCGLAYPMWVPTDTAPTVVRHELADASWRGCLDAVARLACDQLDVRRNPWRLHVFGCELPCGGAGTVVVLQSAHAWADGARSSDVAAYLLGRRTPVPQVIAPVGGGLVGRAMAATRAHRQLVRDTGAGLLPEPVGSWPALATNARPSGERVLRTLVRRRGELDGGATVTIAVLSAISTALSGYLGVETLAAEVPMAKPGVRLGYNHFRNVSVGLYPELSGPRRADRIAADLAGGRRRGEHPAVRAADEAFAAVPAPLLRWGVGKFDPEVRPPRVSGNTVVSSVYRGAADLRFGTAPIRFTAGFPALSPAMGLTHGVHGIGDTIVVSVYAAQSAIADIEDYLQRLDAAL